MSSKIVVIGNSVALRIRSEQDQRKVNDRVYSVLLEDILCKNNRNISVLNFGLSRMLVTEFMKSKDLYIREFPSYYIINIGCVDAPNRDIPLWFSNIIFQRKFHSVHNFCLFLYSSVIKKLSSFLVFLRFKSPWVNPSKFRKSYAQMISLLKKETNAHIITMGINKGNQVVEKKLPGTLSRYLQYNEIIKELSLELGCVHLDVTDLETVDYFPDGVHYNGEGHKLIANRLAEIILD